MCQTINGENMKKKKLKRKYNLEKSSKNRYLIVNICLIILFLILFGRLYQVMILNKDFYKQKLVTLTNVTKEGSSSPRGRIYDRNYRLLVDNKAVKTIIYTKDKKITSDEEIKLAYKISEVIEIDISKLTNRNIRDFWLVKYKEEANLKITKEEWEKLDERKLSLGDIENLKRMRITEEEINSMSLKDKTASYLYYLMNKGYSYDEKVIKQNVTDSEYAYIAEHLSEFKGFDTRLDWERVYLYGDTFRTILGNVSSSEQGIPKEYKDKYLSLGYSLNDRVGISYLELQYESLLKGKKDVYKIISSNQKELIEKGHRGQDIVLTIDILLQQEIEKIIEEEMIYTKKQINTKYYNKSFVVIQDPNTGEILAMSGKQILLSNNKFEIYDYTPGIISSPMTVGSVVKGASMLVGYDEGVLQIGEYMQDECMYFLSTPKKCSWKNLGYINDLDALALSSNIYQFKIAIRVGKGSYIYNGPLQLDDNAFNIYRNMYEQFGLGVKTLIDLPVESLGYKGTSTLPGHLLDFAMGQYDTYTPIQLSQYISTIANSGNRLKPHLLKEIRDYSQTEQIGELIQKVEPVILNTIDVKDEYMDRVRLGFYQVINKYNGLGNGYMDKKYNGSGKTGTSESFLDTDNDGVIDTPTISTSFVGYAPSDNPKMSIVVTSPDVSYISNIDFLSLATKRITKRSVDSFFSLYQ